MLLSELCELRALKKRLIQFLVGFSVALFLATAALWVRSYFRFDSAGTNPHVRKADAFWFTTSKGTIFVHYQVGGMFPAQKRFYHFSYQRTFSQLDVFGDYRSDAFPYFVKKTLGNFGYFHVADRWEQIYGLVMPLWALCVIFAIGPLAAGARYFKVARGKKWAARGQCAACGYDIRATPARCPECGSVQEPKEIVTG